MNAITFKAGKMIREGNTLKADDRKGLVTIAEQEGDGLLHFQWSSDRTGRNVEEDLILFPGDAKLEPVKEAGENARVFLLRFEGNPPRLFLWMQEPKNDDEALVKRINEALGTAGQGPNDMEQ